MTTNFKPPGRNDRGSTTPFFKFIVSLIAIQTQKHRFSMHEQKTQSLSDIKPLFFIGSFVMFLFPENTGRLLDREGFMQSVQNNAVGIL